MSEQGPIILSAHRSLIVAEGGDGLRYEVTRDPAMPPELEPETPERQLTLSFTPEEARRVATYMTAIGWRRVRTISVSLAELRAGQRHFLIDNPNAIKRMVRFAAAGSISCAAVTDGQADGE